MVGEDVSTLDDLIRTRRWIYFAPRTSQFRETLELFIWLWARANR